MKVPDYRAFYRSGEIDETAAVSHRELMERSLIDEIRLKGYVPVLGLGPYYTQMYDFGRERRVFHLTIHGAYVGKDYSHEVEGVDAFTGQRILRPTPQSKSSKSLNTVE